MSKNSIRKQRRYGQGEGYYQYLRGLQRNGLQQRFQKSVEAALGRNGVNVSKGFVDYIAESDGKTEADTAAQLINGVVNRLRVQPPQNPKFEPKNTHA